MKLCLNMIVRNERARISRCLESVVKWIDYWVIVDTGSTDGTQQAIETFFKLHNIPGELHSVPFENFEQARNAALSAARASKGVFDYILLCDADMELVVADENFRDKLTAPAYSVVQRAGTLAYHNTRLADRRVPGDYIGVTHEYLNIPSTAADWIWFKDHADGANRVDKFVRDIVLLKVALEKDPGNGRYWFYLAQSYRDAGMYKEAADAYLKRATMGGWDEETWNARLNYGHCLLSLKDEAGFIREMLAAYNMRPTRVESLYDLAKFYRERGMNAACTLLASAGMKIPYPKDVLFVSEYAHTFGMREEFAIAAYYSPTTRDEGFRVCDDLILDPATPTHARDQAKRNLYFYLKPITDYVSFEAKRIDFDPGTGYIPMNPSICTHDSQIFTTIRTVNYNITPDGRYEIRGPDDSITNDNPIHTRTYLARLNPNSLEIEVAAEILEPANMPAPLYKMVRSFEDMRLISYQGSLWTTSCVREMNAEGYCEQVLARIKEIGHNYQLDDDWRRILPPVRVNEKNWMPFVRENKLRYMYRPDTVINDLGQTLYKSPADLAIQHMSGGSQLVRFYNGYLGLVHEARHGPDGLRYYLHRFVFYSMGERGELRFNRISMPFVFHDKQIEFAAGMAAHPTKSLVIISYGVRDKEAWLGTLAYEEVWRLF